MLIFKHYKTNNIYIRTISHTNMIMLIVSVDTISTVFYFDRSFRLGLLSTMSSQDTVVNVLFRNEQIAYLDRRNFDEIVDTFIHTQ